MKAKILFGSIVLLISASFISAQSVVITPKKITYKRPEAEQDFKKTFTVTRPIVKASTSALSKKIEREISYEKNNNFSLKEEIDEIQWLEEAFYKVNYNKNGILDITLTMEGSAAYPSSFSRTVVVGLKTGSRVKPADIFVDLNGLAAMVRKAQAAEIKKAQAEYKKDAETADFDSDDRFSNVKFTAAELTEFSVSDKGITFLYDYGFPHVVLALQPEGRYFFNWTQLKPFIKRGGLLGKFIR